MRWEIMIVNHKTLWRGQELPSRALLVPADVAPVLFVAFRLVVLVVLRAEADGWKAWGTNGRLDKVGTFHLALALIVPAILAFKIAKILMIAAAERKVEASEIKAGVRPRPRPTRLGAAAAAASKFRNFPKRSCSSN